MSQFGQFDPQNAENPSALFVFQETPVTSSKFNVWNGNITAGFQLLQQTVSLLTAASQDAILSAGGESALRISAQSPEAMTVNVNPGWAVIQNALAGVLEPAALPLGGSFIAPVSNPRIDLIVLRDTGALDILTGTEDPSPQTPAVPDNSIALADVFFRVGSTRIFNSDPGSDAFLTDLRPTTVLANAHKHAIDRFPPEPPDGTRTGFSTQAVFRPGSLDVFVNGVLQTKGLDYTEDADRRGYTFVSPPLSHYRLQHRYLVQYEI